MAATQTQSQKHALLRKLPKDARRVQVVQVDGKVKYKKPEEILHDDQIKLNKDGEPIVMKGTPGRKARIELEPVSEGVGDVIEARTEHMDYDPLLQAAKSDPEGDQVLDTIIVAMAEEASALEFQRNEEERHGRDGSGISAKRARVLKGLADTWLKRKEKLESSMIDMESPAFQTLMRFMLETFKEAMVESGMRPEHVETVFAKLGKRLDDGWKQEAKARMREGK
jgi:hypothetical protein